MSNDKKVSSNVYNILAFTFDGQDTAGQLVKEIKSSGTFGRLLYRRPGSG